MTKFVILEDEPASLRRLQRKISDIRPDWICVGTADGISTGLPLLQMTFDLVFCDIHLSDGDCFKLLQRARISAPIVFTTAYDEYAIKAFDFNSIHYLLKPITDRDLLSAIEKFERTIDPLPSSEFEGTELSGDFKSMLTSRVGNKTILIPNQDIAYVNYRDRMTWVTLFDGKHHLLEHSLDSLVDYLPDNQFFRINRQVIIQKRAVQEYHKASSNRISLQLVLPTPDVELVVSKEACRAFKDWVVT